MDSNTSKDEQEAIGKGSFSSKAFISVFLATFSTVFIAELGDKTQLATLLLSAQSGEPLLVFIGAASALICSSLVGVLVGKALSSMISPDRFEIIAGLVMLLIGIGLGIEAVDALIFSKTIT